MWTTASPHTTAQQSLETESLQTRQMKSMVEKLSESRLESEGPVSIETARSRVQTHAGQSLDLGTWSVNSHSTALGHQLSVPGRFGLG